jgi:N-acyl-D-amino-acid deacylase
MKASLLALVAVLGLGGSAFAHARTCDLVINNGRVMDPEANFDAVRNVHVKDGKIAAITTES